MFLSWLLKLDPWSSSGLALSQELGLWRCPDDNSSVPQRISRENLVGMRWLWHKVSKRISLGPLENFPLGHGSYNFPRWWSGPWGDCGYSFTKGFVLDLLKIFLLAMGALIFRDSDSFSHLNIDMGSVWGAVVNVLHDNGLALEVAPSHSPGFMNLPILTATCRSPAGREWALWAPMCLSCLFPWMWIPSPYFLYRWWFYFSLKFIPGFIWLFHRSAVFLYFTFFSDGFSLHTEWWVSSSVTFVIFTFKRSWQTSGFS